MGSYNVYRNRSKSIGGHFPIWLGKVTPISGGVTLNENDAKPGMFYPAGTPIALENGIASVLHGFSVVGTSVSGDNTVITVKPLYDGEAPTTDLKLMKVGADFSATNKGWSPASVAVNSADAEAYDITVATSSIDALSENDVLAIASGTGAKQSLAVKPTHYLYNDIAIDPLDAGESDSNLVVSCSLVVAHLEGILINRTPAANLKAQMRAACPLVVQEERY